MSTDMCAIAKKDNGDIFVVGSNETVAWDLYKAGWKESATEYMECIEVSVIPKQPVDCRACKHAMTNSNTFEGIKCIYQHTSNGPYGGECVDGSNFKPSERIQLYSKGE